MIGSVSVHCAHAHVPTTRATSDGLASTGPRALDGNGACGGRPGGGDGGGGGGGGGAGGARGDGGSLGGGGGIAASRR